MDKNLEHYDFLANNVSTKPHKSEAECGQGKSSKKCNQCDYATSYASSLRTHLKTHSGEKSNKCNQCDYASSQAGNLKKHFELHSPGKSNK